MFFMSVHLCILVCKGQGKDSFAYFCHTSYNQRQKLALAKLLPFSFSVVFKQKAERGFRNALFFADKILKQRGIRVPRRKHFFLLDVLFNFL